MTGELPLSDWGNFFVAELGAAAALTGLLFVAVSLNLKRILEVDPLPLRASETLLTFTSVLVVSSFGLVPHQTSFQFGLEVGLTGLFVTVFQTLALIRTWHHRAGFFPIRVMNNQLPSLAFIGGAAWLMLGHSGAIVWLVPGTLLSFAAGLFGAWVLLVEIQR